MWPVTGYMPPVASFQWAEIHDLASHLKTHLPLFVNLTATSCRNKTDMNIENLKGLLSQCSEDIDAYLHSLERDSVVPEAYDDKYSLNNFAIRLILQILVQEVKILSRIRSRYVWMPCFTSFISRSITLVCFDATIKCTSSFWSQVYWIITICISVIKTYHPSNHISRSWYMSSVPMFFWAEQHSDIFFQST